MSFESRIDLIIQSPSFSRRSLTGFERILEKLFLEFKSKDERKRVKISSQRSFRRGVRVFLKSLSSTQIHDKRVGAIRRGVSRHLHCQPGRIHDHEGGVSRIHGRGRSPFGQTLVPQAYVQVRYDTLEPYRQHVGQILQGDAHVHEGVQQEQRGRRDRGGYQRVSQFIDVVLLCKTYES